MPEKSSGVGAVPRAQSGSAEPAHVCPGTVRWPASLWHPARREEPAAQPLKQAAMKRSSLRLHLAAVLFAALSTVVNAAQTYTFTTLAGLAGSSGSTDGTGSAARFNNPVGVAVDSAGNVYVVDQVNHTIRKVTPGGVVITLAGLAGSTGKIGRAHV